MSLFVLIPLLLALLTVIVLLFLVASLYIEDEQARARKRIEREVEQIRRDSIRKLK